jgi:hypothetical protein
VGNHHYPCYCVGRAILFSLDDHGERRVAIPFFPWYEGPTPNLPLLAGVAVRFLTKFIPVSNLILTSLLYNTLA